MSEEFKFSRSHQTDLRKCARLALLRFWLDGTGYTRAGISIELGTGSLFHDTMGEVLEWILKMSQECDGSSTQHYPPESVIRAAVDNQYKLYEAQMAAAIEEIIDLGMTDAAERAGWHQTLKRQAVLAESMVRTWLIVRLPYFLANYDLVSVEGEEQSEIAPGLIFMQRKDSVWKHREDQTLHPLEFKTSGNATENFVESWRTDLQQITHLLNFKDKYESDPKSVLLEIVYKGRKYDKEHTGPLVAGYKREVINPDGEVEEVEFDWVAKRCKTKGWQKFFIADEDFGEEGRSSAEVWTRDVLDFETLAMHTLHIEIAHDAKRVQKWVDQTRREMIGVRDGLVQLETCDTDEEFEAMADVMFPAWESKDTCTPYFGSKKCSFFGVCHGKDEMSELHMTQGYKPREPHHPNEWEAPKDV